MLGKVDFEVLSNRALTEDIYELYLAGDSSGITRPGQFVNLAIEGFQLRRPISVCDWGPERLTLVYKVQGRGTAALACYGPGRRLNALTGLGNGFDTGRSGDTPLLVGGGVGTPPLYALAKRLVSQGRRPRALLGFNTAAGVILRERFEALGVPVTVTTADGSAGKPGFVTDGMEEVGAGCSYLYACGPEPMLKAVWHGWPGSGQFSFEERMGCGFGACMGCSRETAGGGYKRVCRDGPVLEKEEILWPEQR